MERIIITANREGYSTDQVHNTLTVRALIDLLSDFDDMTPVYIGNDRQGCSWYTYGGICYSDIALIEEEED